MEAHAVTVRHLTSCFPLIFQNSLQLYRELLNPPMYSPLLLATLLSLPNGYCATYYFFIPLSTLDLPGRLGLRSLHRFSHRSPPSFAGSTRGFSSRYMGGLRVQGWFVHGDQGISITGYFVSPLK